MEKWNSQLKQDSQLSEQDICLARAAQVWLAVNRNTSIPSGE